MNKRVVLIILDGWGLTQDEKISAVAQAQTPFIDALSKQYPTASLRTDGEFVGLPKGQMGNSEVGHMNLGAGRIVYQNLAKINRAVEEKTLGKEKILLETLRYAEKNAKNLHLMGLVSDGGIHAHINHLKGLLEVIKEQGVSNVYLHAFTDGRDCDPKSAAGFIKEIQEEMQKTVGKLASVTGRYYAMDRDNRWERVALAYNAIVRAEGEKSTDAVQSILKSYENNITDEFIQPIVMTDEKGKAIATLQKDDAVIFFNFRTDRGRELTEVLTQKAKPKQNLEPMPLYFTTLTNYDETFEKINVIYDDENINNTLGEVLSVSGKKQIRIAETEKYPHVTFFFSGGKEEPFEGEKRILKNSPKVATYDLKPEMSAYKLKKALIEELQKTKVDFVCLNFANGDMVGHTGVMQAAIEACQVVDECVKQIVEVASKKGYTTLLIADHGNCEQMLNPDGTPHTAHTTNPVPMILIDEEIQSLHDGILADIAPTILELMGLAQPEEMTGSSLL